MAETTAEHGLIGSPEWIEAIGNGTIPVTTVRGIICNMWMASMHDWPVMQLLCDDGSVTASFTRDRRVMPIEPYILGRRVLWRYAEVRSQGPDAIVETSKLTLEIWVAALTRLYRPVGPAELDLIAGAGYATFPPRLPDQPIFYPVCNPRYAAEIASNWNVKESGSGYVTEFDVDTAYLSRYSVQQAGGKDHLEYWIPAEDLAEFNRNIVDGIRVTHSFP